jgi:hypothetical protein
LAVKSPRDSSDLRDWWGLQSRSTGGSETAPRKAAPGRILEWLCAKVGQTFLDSLHLGLQVSQVNLQTRELLCLALEAPPKSKALVVLVSAATVAAALALFLALAFSVSVVPM